MSRYARQGVPYMGDYEHMSLAQPPIKAPASITEFKPEVRLDAAGKPELWAVEIHWTADAQKELEAGHYRLYSPAFMPTLDDSGRPTPDNHIDYLINVALTNLPATFGLEPLVAASAANPSNEESTMDEEKLKELGAKLAQAEKDREEFKGMCQKMSDTVKKLTGKTFDEWAAEESAENDGKDAEKAAQAEEAKAMKALKAAVVSATGKTDLAEASGVLTTMAAQAKELVALKAEQSKQQVELAQKEFYALLATGIKDGKIPPAEKDSLITLKADAGLNHAVKYLRGRLQGDPIVKLRTDHEPPVQSAVDPLALTIAANSAGAFGGVEQFKKMHEPKPLDA
jgi:phage I-like protein